MKRQTKESRSSNDPYKNREVPTANQRRIAEATDKVVEYDKKIAKPGRAKTKTIKAYMAIRRMYEERSKRYLGA